MPSIVEKTAFGGLRYDFDMSFPPSQVIAENVKACAKCGSLSCLSMLFVQWNRTSASNSPVCNSTVDRASLAEWMEKSRWSFRWLRPWRKRATTSTIASCSLAWCRIYSRDRELEFVHCTCKFLARSGTQPIFWSHRVGPAAGWLDCAAINSLRQTWQWCSHWWSRWNPRMYHWRHISSISRRNCLATFPTSWVELYLTAQFSWKKVKAGTDWVLTFGQWLRYLLWCLFCFWDHCGGTWRTQIKMDNASSNWMDCKWDG